MNAAVATAICSPACVLVLVLLLSLSTPSHVNGLARTRTTTVAPDLKGLYTMATKTSSWGPAVEKTKEWIESTVDFAKISPAVVTDALKIFTQAGLIDDVFSVIEVVKRRGGRINAFHYNHAMQACRRHKRPDDVLRLFAQMQSEGLNPDKYSVSAVLPALGEANEWNRALQLYESVAVAERDEIIKGGILQCASKCNKPDAALELFNSFLPATRPAKFYNSVITVLGTAGRWQEALQLYNRMLEETGHDKITFFTMARVLEKEGQVEELASIKQKSHRSGGVGTENISAGSDSVRTAGSGSISLNDALGRARTKGDYAQAVEIADKFMATHRQTWTPSAITQVAQIWGESKQPEKLLELLAAVKDLSRDKEERLQPNTRNYNALMSAFIKCGRPSSALELFNEMPVSKDAFSYGTALLAHERLGDYIAAEECMQMLSRDKIVPSVVMLNTLLSCYAKAQQWDKMLSTYEGMGKSADLVSRRIVLASLERGGQIDTIAKMRGELFSDSALTQASKRNAGFTGAKSGEGEKKGEETEEDEALADGSVSIKVLQQMPELSPAGSLFEKLLEKPAQGGVSGVAKLYAMNGHVTEAISMLDHLPPTLNPLTLMSTYNAIILAAGSIGDWERAYGLLLRMVENNVPRSKTTYTALLHVMTEFGDEDALNEVREWSIKDGFAV